MVVVDKINTREARKEGYEEKKIPLEVGDQIRALAKEGCCFWYET